MFGKQIGGHASNNNVIQDADIDQLERTLQSARDSAVGFARLRVAARVVVVADHRGRVMAQRLLHDLARIRRGMGQRAKKQVLAETTSVTCVTSKELVYLSRLCAARPS